MASYHAIRSLARIGISVCAIMMLLTFIAPAEETVIVRLRYNSESLQIDFRDGWADVRLPNAHLLTDPGSPALPYLAEQVVLPQGMQAVGLRVKPGYGVDAVRHWVELVLRQGVHRVDNHGRDARRHI